MSSEILTRSAEHNFHFKGNLRPFMPEPIRNNGDPGTQSQVVLNNVFQCGKGLYKVFKNYRTRTSHKSKHFQVLHRNAGKEGKGRPPSMHFAFSDAT